MANGIKRIRAAKMAAQDGRCWYCDRPMWSESPDMFRATFRLSARAAHLFRCTAEHLKPRSAAGDDSAANLVAACWFCNVTRHRRKRPLDPEAYRSMVRRRLAAGRWSQLPPARQSLGLSAPV